MTKNRFLEGKKRARARDSIENARRAARHEEPLVTRAPAAKENYYVDPKELVTEIRKCQRSKRVSNELGKIFLNIAYKFASKPNFSGYTYKEDFIGDAVMRMLEQVDKVKLEHPIEKLVSKNGRLVAATKHTNEFFNFPDDPGDREPTVTLKPHGSRSGSHLIVELGKCIKMLSTINVHAAERASFTIHVSADGRAWEHVGNLKGRGPLVLKTDTTSVKYVKVSNLGERDAPVHGVRVYGFVTPNPFSYLTQICYNCFISKINREKKFSEVKESMALDCLNILESEEHIYIKRHGSTNEDHATQPVEA